MQPNVLKLRYFKYQIIQDIGIRKFEFATKTQFFYVKSSMLSAVLIQIKTNKVKKKQLRYMKGSDRLDNDMVFELRVQSFREIL